LFFSLLILFLFLLLLLPVLYEVVQLVQLLPPLLDAQVDISLVHPLVLHLQL
jgi:hypothetical protein